MTNLFMTSMTVNLAALRQQAALQGMSADEGVALHHFLSETFGKGALQPFRLMPGRRQAPTATLYGYGPKNGDALTSAAEQFGVPEIDAVFQRDTIKTKPLPTHFPEGKRLGFDLRVRPVRRLKTELVAESREVRRDILNGKPVKPLLAGAEVDAFLVNRMRTNPSLDDTEDTQRDGREAVYLSWLAHRLKDAAALDETACGLARYVRRKVYRGGRALDGPDATIHGELIVRDPTVFAKLITKGVGRHTAYGYGLLLLRPPGC